MLKKTVFVGPVILALIAAFPVWGGGKPDVKGMEVIIGNWWADYDVNTRKPQNDSEEKQLNQRKKLMQENGVTIKEKAITDWLGCIRKRSYPQCPESLTRRFSYFSRTGLWR